MYLLLRCSVILLLLACSNLTAKEYNLQEILRLANENNRQIQLGRSDVKSANAEVKDAFSEAFPKIDVDAGYNHNLGENVFFFEVSNPETGELESGSFKTSFANEFRMNASLRQTLFSFEVGYGIQAAKYFKKSTNFNFEATRRNVLTTVKIGFYRAILLKEAWEVAMDSEQSGLDNYENIKVKYESGISSEFELLQAEVRWQNSIPATLSARQDYELALNDLKFFVGIPIEEEIELTGSFSSFPELPERKEYQQVLDLRPDYQALAWERKLWRKNVGVQSAGHFPRLDGFFRWDYAAASDEIRLERENDNYVAGLTLSIPIFSGGSTTAKVQKAKADLEKADTRLAEANDNIKVELENLQLRLKEARERIKATNKAIQSARRAFEIAETRVENGLSTQVELKDSRLALDRAQFNYLVAVFDYLSAFFEWELATGVATFNEL